MSDPQKYRTKEEVNKYKAQDPILFVKEIIEKNKLATEKQFEEIAARVKATVEESIKFAEESPEPDANELYKDIYVEDNYPYIMDNKF